VLLSTLNNVAWQLNRLLVSSKPVKITPQRAINAEELRKLFVYGVVLELVVLIYDSFLNTHA